MLEEKRYSVKEISDILGVTTRTIRRWDSEGRLIANRTKTGRLYYTDKHIKDYYQE